jgi:hypothetical protein
MARPPRPGRAALYIFCMRCERRAALALPARRPVLYRDLPCLVLLYPRARPSAESGKCWMSLRKEPHPPIRGGAQWRHDWANPYFARAGRPRGQRRTQQVRPASRSPVASAALFASAAQGQRPVGAPTRERRPTNGRRCRWRRGYHDKWKLRRNARDGRGPGRSEASQRATCHAQHGFQQYFRGRPGHITRRSPCFLLKLSIALRVRGRARPGARPSTSDTRGAEWAARCGDELVSK